MAESRYDRAFASIRRVVDYDREEAERVNRFFVVNAPLLSGHREQIVAKTRGALRDVYARDARRLSESMQRTGLGDFLSTEVSRLVSSLRLLGEPERTTRARVRRALREDATATVRIEDALRQAADVIGDFGEGAENVLRTARGLFVESGAAFVRRQVDAGRRGVVFEELARSLSTPTLKAFTSDDEVLVDEAFGRVPKELADAIANRSNRITSVRLTDQMFEVLREIIREAMYENAGGALGGRDIANIIADRFGGLLGDDLDEIERRAELWARTEGAVAQNDALLSVGVDAGMDGKIWQNVGDGLVRTFETSDGDHVINDADGIIALNETFSDGSTDGGSGSVSPYNCRCAVGPALLEDARRGRRD